MNPNGQATTYHFEYGTSTAYGAQAPAPPDPSAGSASSAQPVSANLTGLAANTTYHYRLVATNGSGLTTGSDQTFTTTATLPPPPTVVTGSASAIISSSATVTGSVNPNGQTTTYHFEYGTTTAYGAQAPAPPDPSAGSGSSAQPVSANLTGLAANTTYHYRLVATNGSGLTTGADQTFSDAGRPHPRRDAHCTVTTGLGGGGRRHCVSSSA